MGTTRRRVRRKETDSMREEVLTEVKKIKKLIQDAEQNMLFRLPPVSIFMKYLKESILKMENYLG